MGEPQPIRGLPAIGYGECCHLLLETHIIEVHQCLGVSLGVFVVADTSDWCSWWHSNCIDA